MPLRRFTFITSPVSHALSVSLPKLGDYPIFRPASRGQLPHVKCENNSVCVIRCYRISSSPLLSKVQVLSVLIPDVYQGRRTNRITTHRHNRNQPKTRTTFSLANRDIFLLLSLLSYPMYSNKQGKNQTQKRKKDNCASFVAFSLLAFWNAEPPYAHT